jgi:hypothetical protein
MSTPDNPNSKGAPSLLGSATEPSKGSPKEGESGRILAGLEGRVVPPAAPPAVKKGVSKPLVLGGGVLFLVVAGLAAWHLAGPGSTTSVASAPVPAAAPASAVVASATPQPASPVAAQAAASTPASASHAATILADDNAAPANAQAASGAQDNGQLSQALSNGARDSETGAVIAAHPAHMTRKEAREHRREERLAEKQRLADERREREAARHQEHLAAVARQHKAPQATDTGRTNDSDVDLIEALVARTSPAGDSGDRLKALGSGAHPAAANSTPHTSPHATATASAGNLTLAQRLKACSEENFFDEQVCRWHACSGHWGADPECPEARRTASP